MGWLEDRWTWFFGFGVGEQAGVAGALVGSIALLWGIYTHFAKRSVSASSVSQSIKGSSATASGGAEAVVATGNVTIERDPLVNKVVETLTQQLQAKDQALSSLQEREQSLQAELRKAVFAIPKQTSIANSKARIKEALEQAAKGNTELAEAIFSEVAARKSAEGKAANREAAEAERHRGALAFLHNTDKALAAYRRATELDPDNVQGWTQLGHLLRRVGELEEAEAAYRKALALHDALGSKEGMANQYGNLGLVHRIRGDLDQAEAMHRNALALHEALGSKEGIANQYGSMGVVYQTRGDLDQAEAMHRNALALDEAGVFGPNRQKSALAPEAKSSRNRAMTACQEAY